MELLNSAVEALKDVLSGKILVIMLSAQVSGLHSGWALYSSENSAALLKRYSETSSSKVKRRTIAE